MQVLGGTDIVLKRITINERGRMAFLRSVSPFLNSQSVCDDTRRIHNHFRCVVHPGGYCRHYGLFSDDVSLGETLCIVWPSLSVSVRIPGHKRLVWPLLKGIPGETRLVWPPLSCLIGFSFVSLYWLSCHNLIDFRCNCAVQQKE